MTDKYGQKTALLRDVLQQQAIGGEGQFRLQRGDRHLLDGQSQLR